jgi:type VI secretion system protein ImpF
MREPKIKIIEGARALLFDRLRDVKSSEELQPLRAFNQNDLRDSVCRELERLLNTRCPTPEPLLAEEELTVIDYGVPDFSTFSPQNSGDRERLASILSRIISAFEPRLQQVQTGVEPFTDNPQALLVSLKAVLVVESFREPVHFSVIVQRKSGECKVFDLLAPPGIGNGE